MGTPSHHIARAGRQNAVANLDAFGQFSATKLTVREPQWIHWLRRHIFLAKSTTQEKGTQEVDSWSCQRGNCLKTRRRKQKKAKRKSQNVPKYGYFVSLKNEGFERGFSVCGVEVSNNKRNKKSPLISCHKSSKVSSGVAFHCWYGRDLWAEFIAERWRQGKRGIGAEAFVLANGHSTTRVKGKNLSPDN